MYVWQMNDGRWHVSAETSVEFNAATHRYFERGYETRQEAEAALKSWRDAGGIVKRKW